MKDHRWHQSVWHVVRELHPKLHCAVFLSLKKDYSRCEQSCFHNLILVTFISPRLLSPSRRVAMSAEADPRGILQLNKFNPLNCDDHEQTLDLRLVPVDRRYGAFPSGSDNPLWMGGIWRRRHAAPPPVVD